MRSKLTLILSLLFAFSSGAFCQTRSVEEAISIAKDVFSPLKNSTNGFMSPSRRPVSDYDVHYSSEFLEMNRSSLQDEVFYVINMDYSEQNLSGNGFVIVSTDYDSNPIIGFSDKGCLVPSDVPENIGNWLKSYVSDTNDNIINIQKRDYLASYSGNVNPICSTEWGQDTPFNDLCPTYNAQRTLTGCVATAMAQIMKVYNSPTKAKGQVSYTTTTRNLSVSSNLSQYTFNWSSMLDSYDNGYSAAQGKSVAELMYACGVSVNMDYDVDGSASNSSRAINGLVENFGYDSDLVLLNKDMMSLDEWHQFLIKELQNGRPIYYEGVSSDNAGHAFILDGYKINNGEPYYHINWGWEGYGNGYFRMGTLKADIPDADNYSLDNSAIINIMPDNGVTDYESFLQAEKINVSPLRVMINQLPTVTVSIGNIYNFMRRDFSGKLKFYLVGNGVEHYLGQSSQMSGVPTNSGFSSLSYSFSLPSSISVGEYKLEVRSVSNSGTKEERVYCGNGQETFTVASASEVYYPNVMYTSIDAQIAENGEVSLSVANIMNFAEMAFSGKISMAIADNSGEIIQRFGSTTSVSGLNKLYHLNNARVVSGTLPSGLQDGNYRIYLVANQDGFEGWAKLTRYTIQNNSITEYGKDGYVAVVMENGRPVVSDVNLPEFYPEIMVTDFAISSFNATNRTVAAQAYQIANFGETDFSGKVSMAVIDYHNNVIATFGSVVSVSGLSHYQLLDNPQSVSGTIPESLADGDYRVCLVAGQSGCKGWAIIKKYTLSGGYIQSSGLDCYRNFWVRNGKILLEEPAPVRATSITLNQTTADLGYLGTITLSATVMPENTVDKTVTWTSSNSGVASVNSNGVVTAVGEGRAIITAKTNDGSNLSASCTVNVVFPRYTLTYIVDGNVYHSESVVIGASITALAAPTKEGYTFSGWSEIPATMPAHDVTVTGSFTVNKYKLTYVLDGETYSETEVAYGTSLTLIAAPSKEGYTFSGWSEIPATMPAHDVTVTGSFTVNKYKLTYVLDGETYSETEVAYGTSLTLMAAPTKEGYTFSGWSEIPATMPAHDVTVTGSFSINSYTLTYTVDGQVYHTETVEYGAVITLIAEPVREGETFSGWKGAPATMPAHDVTITGSFGVNMYTITYVVDGEVYHTEQIEYGATVTAIAAPSKEGYTFSGWSEIPANMPAHDVTVTGSFTVNSYTLTYTVDGQVYHTETVEYGAVITLIDEPVREGETFSGWKGAPATMPAHDVTITGSFGVNMYTITYVVDGEVYYTEQIEYGASVSAIAAPSKEGYTFSGWSEIPATMPAHDVVVEGYYLLNQYRLSFVVDGDTVYSDNVYYGSVITVPADPEKDGYVFDGWENVPETMPAYDLVITGSFTKIDGIDQVLNEVTFRVYDVSGRFLGLLTQKEINRLKQGVYIVNNRKVYIK